MHLPWSEWACGRDEVVVCSLYVMLHHYLCAYVGPPSEFKDGERLRCPKCGRFLSDKGDDWEELPGPAIMQLAERPAGD